MGVLSTYRSRGDAEPMVGIAGVTGVIPIEVWR
jgi:hypothetical protein